MTAFAPTLQAFFTQYLISQRQAAHRVRLPGRLPAVADLHRRPHRQVAGPAGLRRPGRQHDQRLPDPSGTRPRRQRGDPQRPVGRGAVAVPVRVLPPPGARRADRPSAVDPRETHRPPGGHLPHPPGNPGAAHRTRPQRLDRTTRPHAAHRRRPDRAPRSELTGLCRADIVLGRGAHLRVTGKGRKERVTPLSKHTAAIVQTWLDERGGTPEAPLFPGPSGHSLGRDAIRKLVIKHATTASTGCPSIAAKHVGVHTLRHSSQ